MKIIITLYRQHAGIALTEVVHRLATAVKNRVAIDSNHQVAFKNVREWPNSEIEPNKKGAEKELLAL